MTDKVSDIKGKSVVDKSQLNPSTPSKRSRVKAFFRTRSKSPLPVRPGSGTLTANQHDAAHGFTNNVPVATSQPTHTSHRASSISGRQDEPSSHEPIAELWNVAYEELKAKEGRLITEYEKCLSYNVSNVLGATVALSGLTKVQRREQMEMLVKRKVEEDEKGKWKIPFGDDRIAVRDLAKPVVGIVSWAQEYVGDALQASPYGSLAWAGVCLLLPVSLSQVAMYSFIFLFHQVNHLH